MSPVTARNVELKGTKAVNLPCNGRGQKKFSDVDSVKMLTKSDEGRSIQSLAL